MRFLLVIICALLVKGEAEAQTWWRITPRSEKLRQISAFQDNQATWHFLAFRDEPNSRILYHLKSDKNTWDSITPVVAGTCTGNANSTKPGQKIPYHFGFSNIWGIQKNTVIFFLGYQNLTTCTPNTFPLNPSSAKLKLASVDSLSELSPNLSHTDSIFSKFRIPEHNLIFFSMTNDSISTIDNETLEVTTYPLPITPAFNYMTAFRNDPRNPDRFYFGWLNEEFTGGSELYSNQVFVTNNKGKDWELIFESPKLSGDNPSVFLIEDIIIPPTSYNHFLFKTDAGIFSVNEVTKKVDTALRGYYYRVASKENEFMVAFGDNNTSFSKNAGRSWKTISKNVGFKDVNFQANSTTAYAYTNDGTIYRSKNLFETVETYSTKFFKKTIFNLLPLGEDSLIVETDDGIWANYTLPVSVKEENPFKNNELTITPNPANTSLKISFLKTDVPQQLLIYNSLGQIVFKTEFSGEFVWDFKNDVPDGIYTVAVQSGGQSVAKQVVILK